MQLSTMVLMEVKVTPLGEEVRRRRRDRNMSQEDLAEMLGITREGVSQIERGETKRPTNDVQEKMVDALDLSRAQISYLLGEGPPPSQLDLGLEIDRIAALPTPRERAEALRRLPPSVHTVLESLALERVREMFDESR